MSIAFVLGNGISRRGMPLAYLQQHGMIYGCNALYRDFIPDVLVSTDRPIAEHIEKSGYPTNYKFYTRRPNTEIGSLVIPKPYFGYSSGPVAVALAAFDGHQRIYMIGFDMGPTAEKKFNNIYADSEFYKNSMSPPTYTGNWVKQVKQICKDFANTSFVRVCGSTTARIHELDNIKNLDHWPLEQFLNQINTPGDL